jgi:hypothetical protein
MKPVNEMTKMYLRAIPTSVMDTKEKADALSRKILKERRKGNVSYEEYNLIITKINEVREELPRCAEEILYDMVDFIYGYVDKILDKNGKSLMTDFSDLVEEANKLVKVVDNS